LELGYPGCYEERRTVIINGSNQVMPVDVLSGNGGAGGACDQNASIMSHELGHAMGVASAPVGFLHTSDFTCETWPSQMPITFTDPTYNAADCGLGTGTPGATFYPYGAYDFMGYYRGNPTVYWKLKAGWLTSSQVPQVSTQTTATLDGLEVASSGTKGLQIPLGADQAGNPASYWVEYRSQAPVDLETPTLSAGNGDLVMVWVNLPDVPGTSVQEGNSIVNQSQVYTFNEYFTGNGYPTLTAGSSFVDPYRGVSVTRNTNPSGGAVPQASVTVNVTTLAVSPNIGASLSGTANQNIVVTNNGTAPVNQTAATITGQDAASFQIVSDGCGGKSLLPAAQCTIVVTQARAAGDTTIRYGTVQWTSSDSIRTTPAIGLIGNP
jgi:hypothetical protein